MNPITEKQKIAAQKLFKKGEYNQKDIAKKVGVTPKTMSHWVNKYGWKNDNQKKLYQNGNPLLDYLRYLKNEHQDTYKTITNTFDKFQKSNNR